MEQLLIQMATALSLTEVYYFSNVRSSKRFVELIWKLAFILGK